MRSEKLQKIISSILKGSSEEIYVLLQSQYDYLIGSNPSRLSGTNLFYWQFCAKKYELGNSTCRIFPVHQTEPTMRFRKLVL